jgi:hypothetical protein
MPWLSSGTMQHPNLLSPRFLNIPNILPSDFSPSPNLPPTPMNNQTLAVPFPTWHFRICFVAFSPKASQIFWPCPILVTPPIGSLSGKSRVNY